MMDRGAGPVDGDGSGGLATNGAAARTACSRCSGMLLGTAATNLLCRFRAQHSAAVSQRLTISLSIGEQPFLDDAARALAEAHTRQADLLEPVLAAGEMSREELLRCAHALRQRVWKEVTAHGSISLSRLHPYSLWAAREQAQDMIARSTIVLVADVLDFLAQSLGSGDTITFRQETE